MKRISGQCQAREQVPGKGKGQCKGEGKVFRKGVKRYPFYIIAMEDSETVNMVQFNKDNVKDSVLFGLLDLVESESLKRKM